MTCPACGGDMKRNGHNSSGRTRWRCKTCGASTTQRYSSSPKHLRAFLRWLLGKQPQSELDMPARTFRGKTQEFWRLNPVLPVCDEIHHVVFMDGLWVGHGAVLLIACTDEHVIGCHLAKSENSKDWGCLMSRIAPPDVLVCDGAGGIEKARRAHWPKTRVQRCMFHVFGQIKRCTTTRPRLQAGAELYGLAKGLLHINDLGEAASWLAAFSSWCTRWEEFLREKTVVDGKSQYRHKRLRKARRALERLCREGTLFTYLDEELIEKGRVPSTSNKIESNNACIRAMLRNHRGMSVEHRIKAVFWWCYMHSEAPISYARMIEEFPTDNDVREWRRLAAETRKSNEGSDCQGAEVLWSEFHMSGSKTTGWF